MTYQSGLTLKQLNQGGGLKGADGMNHECHDTSVQKLTKNNEIIHR